MLTLVAPWSGGFTSYPEKERRYANPNPLLQGLEPKNLCNRGGKSRSGVQLELSRSVRETMFLSLSREGRKHTTPEFAAFVGAIRSVLNGACSPAPPSARDSAEVARSIKAGS